MARTPETEPLLGVDAFVKSDLDREDTKALLLLLGVRNTPAGADSILLRIRALATSLAPPMRELAKWYDALDRVLARRRPEELATIRTAFLSERLIFSSNGEWVRASEVFLRLTEECPTDLPVLHPDFVSLAMWPVVGVADRPSADLLIAHLKRWETGRKLDGNELRRVRAVMQQFAERIWRECEHWLSLDGSWARVSDLDMALFDDGTLRVRELFPAFKSRTADCKSLRSDLRMNPPFSKLRDLAEAMEFRIGSKQANLPRSSMVAWMSVLGNALARIQLPDQSQQIAVRESGRRLALTVWQPFDVLGVTPYLDETPAGQEHQPEVLWDEQTLYVRQISIAKLIDPVVSELNRYIQGDSLQKVIRNCFNRDESFVEEYIAAHLSLVEIPAVVVPPEDDVAVDAVLIDELSANDDAVSDGTGEISPEVETDLNGISNELDAEQDEAVPDASDVAEPTEPEPTRQGRERQPRNIDNNPPLISQFAKARGYAWDSALDAYVHQDGSTIHQSNGVFGWEQRLGDEVLCRYSATEQCLTRGGVEIAAELWDLLRKSQQTTALILNGEDHRPHALSGSDLVRMVDGESLTLFPAKYRLRKTEFD